MKVSIVQIGNSRGIRIPKAILDQCEVKTEVDLDVQDGKIVLDPRIAEPRTGWDQQFAKMAENQDDSLLIDDSVDLEVEDWEW